MAESKSRVDRREFLQASAVVDRPMFYVDDCPYGDSSAVGERQWRSIDDRAVVNPISWSHRFGQDQLLVEGVAACASLYPIILSRAGAP